MKKLVIFAILFLVACSQASLKPDAEQLDSVRLFKAMAPDASYSEKSFDADETAAMKELIDSECPAIRQEFTRGVYRTEGASLILYHSNDTFECLIFHPSEGGAVSYESGEDSPGTAAVVNGEPVSLSAVRESLSALPEQSRSADAIGQVLLQLIDDELLRQEAAGIEVTAEELAEVREQILLQLGLTSEELLDFLERQGISSEEFEQQVVRQARLSKLLRERLLLDDVGVSSAAAREYYLQNTNEFMISEQARMRHIFISNEGRNASGVQSRLAIVLQRLNTTDFCSVEEQYSDDEGQPCGTYVIPRGAINPNLEYAAFNTPPNETAIVNTGEGIHIVQTIAVQPAQVLPYGQVEGSLQDALTNNVLQQRLALYLSILRARADIVVYST